MIRKVDAPIGDVARKILEYVDPETGQNIFELSGFNPDSDSEIGTITAELGNPESLTLDAYWVTYRHRSEDCAVKDPTHLNAGVAIADIETDYSDRSRTDIRWRTDWKEKYGDAFEKLEKLLTE